MTTFSVHYSLNRKYPCRSAGPSSFVALRFDSSGEVCHNTTMLPQWILIMSKKQRDLLISALVLLVSCALSILLIEGALRLFFIGSLFRPEFTNQLQLHPPHPTRGWAPAPGRTALIQTFEYHALVHINSKGLRDREHEYEPVSGVFRIAILGDSFMEGYHVEMEQSLPRRLERLLADRSVEVINLGVVSYGCGQEYLCLKEEGLKYKPDLVLLAFYAENDVRNDSQPLETMIWGKENRAAWARPYPRWDDKTQQMTFAVPDFERAQRDFKARLADLACKEEAKLPWQRTLTYDVVAKIARSWGQRAGISESLYNPNVLFHAFLRGFDPEAYTSAGLSAGDYERLCDEAWTMTTQIIKGMRDLAAEQHARFAVFTVPARVQTDMKYLDFVKRLYPRLDFDLDKTDRLLAKLAAEAHIPLLDLTPAFREHYAQNGGPLFFPEDRHWNAAGHQLAAAELAEFLRAQGLVP